MSWRTSTSTSASAHRTRRSPPPPPPLPRPIKPGLFAPKGEKELFASLARNDPAEFERIALEHDDVSVVAATLAGIAYLTHNDDEKSRKLFESVLGSGQDPAAHPFFTKYIHSAHFTLTIAPGVDAELPIDRNSVGITLAEIYQEEGNAARAAELVEHLEPTSVTAVSLAELYSALGRADDVIHLTEGVTNGDDGTALLCVYRGIAFAHKELRDAAREAFREALRARSRNATIRHKALFERAQTYIADGRKAPARKDLERILADDSDFPGVTDLLTSLT
jgi:tetratricopeptide (TPR) repeat protein